MSTEDGRYDLEKAQEEAFKIHKKVTRGEADNYSDAEAQLAGDFLELRAYVDLLGKARQGPDQLSAEEREKLRRHGYYYLENNKNPYEARRVFEALQDYEGLRKALDFYLKEGEKSTDVPLLLNLLEDYEGVRVFLNSEVAQISNEQSELMCQEVFAPLDRAVYEHIDEYLKRNGIKSATGAVNRGVDLVTIRNLIKNYDIGVPIARGGLNQGAIADLWGMETRIIDIAAHNRKVPRGKWINPVSSEDFEGKNVLLFDKDAVTGVSVKKTVKMLSPHKPGIIGIYFTHRVIPSGPGASFGTKTAGLPPEVKVFSHNTVPMDNAGDTYLEAHERLGTLYGRRRLTEKKYTEEIQILGTKHPDVARALKECAARKFAVFDALNPKLEGVSEVRESILNQLEQIFLEHVSLRDNDLYDGSPNTKNNFIRLLDNATALAAGFERELVVARYEKQGKEAAEKRGIENPHVPVSPLGAFVAAHKAVQNGFDVVVIVGPEGFAYEPYFKDLGLSTVAVNIPESLPDEPRSFRALDDLSVLQGKRVLVVEDDVRTGATLETLLEKIKPYAPEKFGLYLGQPIAFQEQANIPQEFKNTFIASDTAPEQDGLDFQQYLKSKGLKIFKKEKPE